MIQQKRPMFFESSAFKNVWQWLFVNTKQSFRSFLVQFITVKRLLYVTSQSNITKFFSKASLQTILRTVKWSVNQNLIIPKLISLQVKIRRKIWYWHNLCLNNVIKIHCVSSFNWWDWAIVNIYKRVFGKITLNKHQICSVIFEKAIFPRHTLSWTFSLIIFHCNHHLGLKINILVRSLLG